MYVFFDEQKVFLSEFIYKNKHMKYSSVMYIVLFNTSLLFILEIVAHWKSNAVSILGEAFHMLSDLLTVGISVGATYVSSRYKGTKRCTFGLERLEVLCSALSILLLWIPSVFLLYLSVQRFYSPKSVDRHILLSTSSVSLLINLINLSLSVWLNHKTCDMNVTSLYLHALSDLAQSIGMFISAFALYINNDWIFVDVFCSSVGAVICFCSSLKLLKEVITILMDISPISVSDVRETLLGVSSISSVEDIRVWSLNRRNTIAMAKISLFHGESQKETLALCRDLLKRNNSICYSNIEVIS